MSRPDPTLVSVETFRKLVSAGPGEVEALLKSGAIRRAAPGRVPLVEAVRAFISHVRASARDATAAAAMSDARSARAEASELSVSIQSRELIRDEEAEAAMQHVAGAILETFAGLPARVSRDRADRAVIETALCAAQAALSDELAELAAPPAAPGAGPTPARPARAQSTKGGGR